MRTVRDGDKRPPRISRKSEETDPFLRPSVKSGRSSYSPAPLKRLSESVFTRDESDLYLQPFDAAERGEKISTLNAIFLLFCGGMGSGILGLPGLFAANGFVPALLLIIIGGLFSALSQYYLLKVGFSSSAEVVCSTRRCRNTICLRYGGGGDGDDRVPLARSETNFKWTTDGVQPRHISGWGHKTQSWWCVVALVVLSPSKKCADNNDSLTGTRHCTTFTT